MLNGSHVSLSFPSALLGYARIDDAMKNELIYKYVENYLKEVMPSVPDIPVDLNLYSKLLLKRYSNTAIGD